jgi:AcrR family transcriptional regulator
MPAATEHLHTTKLAILDAAERLFSRQGFEGTSLRALTTQAGVNLGAVNYHFSSKDALVLAVLKRRMKPLNEERLALLAQFERDCQGGAVSPEKILEALFRPLLELIERPSKGGRYFLRLIGQCLANPGAYLKPLIQEEFAEKMRRFHAALRKSLPGLSEEEAYWRLYFAMGAMVYTVANSQMLEYMSGGRCRVAGVEDTLTRLIAFCAAGLKADTAKDRNSKDSCILPKK